MYVHDVYCIHQVVLKTDWRVKTCDNGTQLSFLFHERYIVYMYMCVSLCVNMLVICFCPALLSFIRSRPYSMRLEMLWLCKLL